MPVHAIARPLDNPLISRWLYGVRQRRGLRIITKWGAAAPMLEVLDFLGQLRSALGPAAPIVVGPVMLDREGQPVPAAPADVSTWRRKLQSVGDPWLHLAAMQEEAA